MKVSFSKGYLLMFRRLGPFWIRAPFIQAWRLCHCKEARCFRPQNNSWFVVRYLNSEECFRRKYAFKWVVLLHNKVSEGEKEVSGTWAERRIFELTSDFTAFASHIFFDLLWKCDPDHHLWANFFFILGGVRDGVCFCVQVLHSLIHIRGGIGQNVARLDTKFKRNILHSSESKAKHLVLFG